MNPFTGFLSVEVEPVLRSKMSLFYIARTLNGAEYKELL